MENQMDMHKKDNYKGQISDVSHAVAASIQKLELFKSKSLKMASALHLVTELFSETEPVRNALREQAIALVLIAADQRAVESSEAIDNAQFVLDTTMSLIDVLNTSRLLSDMNAQILRTELSALSQLLNSIAIPSAKLSELVLHDLFATSVIDSGSVTSVASVGNPSDAGVHLSEKKSESSDIVSVPEIAPTSSKTFQRSTSKSSVATSKTTSGVPKKTSEVLSKSDRQAQILAVIGNNGSSIKDIAKAIQGCSEKTIQRELNALIGQGRIVREGEKRWSIYKKT